MPYLVYAVSFVTSRGTKRCYIGCTSSLDVRRHWHEKRPPAWMRAAGKQATFQYEVLEEGLSNKGEALAAEALWAARRIKKNPQTARGGPLVKAHHGCNDAGGNS